jgi:hypothetical protein
MRQTYGAKRRRTGVWKATLRALVVGIAVLALSACRAEVPAPPESGIEGASPAAPGEVPAGEQSRLGRESEEGESSLQELGPSAAPTPRFGGGGPEVDASPLGLLGPVFPGFGGDSHSSHCDPFEDSSEICL